MKVLILDDDKQRQESFLKRMLHKGWESDHVETAKKAIQQLQLEEYDLIFLDHDLSNEIYVESGRSDTGAEVARILLRLWGDLVKKPIVITHSLNEAGRNSITSILSPVIVVKQIPFLWVREVFNRVF